ncbi:MAG: 50S ribosomal protein L13 [Patescibacteria group bacterium]
MNNKKNTITIDAKDKILGRVATQIASLLRGKDLVDFVPYKIPDRKIIIENTDKIKFSGKKTEKKIYYRHTGYPGGIKEEKLADLIKRDYKEVIKRAVNRMLPDNKLRKEMMKNLIIQ